MLKTLAVTLILIVTTSCSTIGPKFTHAPSPGENESLVYVMRNTIFYHGAYWSNFYVNDQEIVELYDSGYSWVHLKPGEYTFLAAWNSHETKFNLNIQKGKVYYLELDQKKFFPIFEILFQPLKIEEGEELIKSYSYKKANPLTNL